MGMDTAARNAVSIANIKAKMYGPMYKWFYQVSQARRNGLPINIVGALDSLTAGASGSSYIDTFRPLVQAVLGDGGVGWVPFNTTPVAAEGGSFGKSASTEANNSSFAAGTDAIYDPNLFNLTFTGTGFANMTDKNHIFTKATVYYLKQNPGFTFKFGDSTNVAGQTAIDTSAASKAIGFTTHSGTWPSQKNNTVQCSSVQAGVHLMGVDLRNGSTGARVHRLAQGGTQARQIAQLDGASYTAFLKNIGCDMYILNAGMNDAPAGRQDEVQYDADIRTILGWVKNANPNALIILYMPNDSTDAATVTMLDKYRQKLLLIKRDFDAEIFDARWVLGSFANANAKGLMADGIHPNSAANVLLGQALFNFIGGEYLANIDDVLLS